MADAVIVLATKNSGKILEIGELLLNRDIQIKGLADFAPIPPVIEDGSSFAQNAEKKAKTTAMALGLPAMADDSGLVVKALGGAPGVYSARFAGENASDSENNTKLLKEMVGKTCRDAFFETAICLALPSGTCFFYRGRCEGNILEGPQGTKGFGYDPLFFYPPLKKSFAQMDNDEKNRVSHRGKAIRALINDMDRIIKLIC